MINFYRLANSPRGGFLIRGGSLSLPACLNRDTGGLWRSFGRNGSDDSLPFAKLWEVMRVGGEERMLFLCKEIGGCTCSRLDSGTLYSPRSEVDNTKFQPCAWVTLLFHFNQTGLGCQGVSHSKRFVWIIRISYEQINVMVFQEFCQSNTLRILQ